MERSIMCVVGHMKLSMTWVMQQARRESDTDTLHGGGWERKNISRKTVFPFNK